MGLKNRISRRRMLQGTTAAGLAGVAGCTGDGDGDGDNGTPTPTEQMTPTPTQGPEPYSATAGGVGADLGIVPFIAALVDLLPEATDNVYTGEYQQFSSGRLVLQSVISGNIEMYTGGLGAVYQAFAAGADLQIIMPMQTGTDYAFAIREDVPELASFTEEGNDLDVGISSIGGLSHTMAVGAFLAEGLPAGNVNWVEIGGSSTRTAAVASGNIDGTPIHRGQFERIVSEGAAVKMGLDISQHYPNFIQAALTVRTREVEENPEYYQELANQLAVANQNTMNDFEWVFQKTQKFQAQPLSRDDAMTTWDVNQNLDAWPTAPIGTEPYQAVYDMMAEGGIIDAEIDIEALVNTEISGNAFDAL